MSLRTSPATVLYPGGGELPALGACEHYAGSEARIRKAMALQRALAREDRPTFDLTADCEDGAPAGAEREHAEMIADLLCTSDNRYSRIGVRIHDVRHPHWRDDLAIVIGRACARLPYIVLPKLESLADLDEQCAEIEALREAAGRGTPIPVHALIETPGALHSVWQIAAHPRVESIDFGLMDFVSAHHGAIPADAMRSPGQFDHPLIRRAKCEISSAALANHIIPTHNVCTELADVSAVQEDARRARGCFGFLRMWSIHPAQIEPILAAMAPPADELQRACEILCLAQDAHWGPVRSGTTLHDRASYRYYWDVLRRARSSGAELPSEALERFFTPC